MPGLHFMCFHLRVSFLALWGLEVYFNEIQKYLFYFPFKDDDTINKNN